MNGYWERAVTFRERDDATLCREGDGSWWICDAAGNEVENLTQDEINYWGQYVRDWRAE